MRSKLSLRQLAVRLRRGELRPLLPRVELDEHVARTEPTVRIRM